MKISELKSSLSELFKAKVPVLLWGAAGVGKTEAVAQIAKENNMQFITLNLGTQEVGDLLGLPDFQDGKTVHRLPNWFPTDPDSKGVLFLDEINRAQRYVLQAVFSLVLEGRLHTSFLPKGWHIVAAANPYSEEYTVTDINDEAFMTRFCHIKVSNDVEEWSRYANSVGTPNTVTSFALEQRSLFQDKSFNLPNFTPRFRSLSALGRVVAQTTLSEQQMFEVATGILGTAAGVAFMTHYKDYQSAVRGLDVLNDWNNVKGRIQQLSQNNGLSSRADVLNATNVEIMNELVKMEKIPAKVKKNLLNYLIEIPKDLSVGMSMNLLQNDKTRDLVANEDVLVDHYKSVFQSDELKALVNSSEKKEAA